MKIVGILVWYDEDPAWLAACVASLAKAEVEHVVAVDGAFALYPNGTPTSGSEQHAAIQETCRGAGIGWTLHVPPIVWLGNEVEKRSFAFRLAETLTTEVDWYFLMDADQIVTTAVGLRDKLEATDKHVGEVRFHDEGEEPLSGFPVRCVFRALRGLHLAGNHFTYALPDGRCLWGQSRVREPVVEPAEDLSFVEVEHRAKRQTARRAAQLAYYERRSRLNAENEFPSIWHRDRYIDDLQRERLGAVTRGESTTHVDLELARLGC